MMDHFLEEVVTKRNTTVQTIMLVIANIAMVVFALIAVIWLQNTITVITNPSEFGGITGILICVVITLLTGGSAVLLFLFRDRIKTEYEYTFTNGDLDFAMVFNNSKRKTLGTMKVKNVETFGPVDSDHFRRLINTPNMKQRKWFLNRDANLYFFYYQKENNKNIIVLEPSDEMVSYIKKYLPRGVYQE